MRYRMLARHSNQAAIKGSISWIAACLHCYIKAGQQPPTGDVSGLSVQGTEQATPKSAMKHSIGSAARQFLYLRDFVFVLIQAPLSAVDCSLGLVLSLDARLSGLVSLCIMLALPHHLVHLVV